MKAKRESFTSISVRVTPQERERLDMLAGKQSLSAYARERLLGDDAQPRKRILRHVQSDHTLLAELLVQLGASRMANNLNQIAKAINMDAVILNPQQQEALLEACQAVMEMRTALMQGLGLRR
jgi:hypothetical protein